jgi:hypothetical protein
LIQYIDVTKNTFILVVVGREREGVGWRIRDGKGYV